MDILNDLKRTRWPTCLTASVHRANKHVSISKRGFKKTETYSSINIKCMLSLSVEYSWDREIVSLENSCIKCKGTSLLADV
jgi:hypothetical protein